MHEWWREIDHDKGNFELPIKKVADYFIKKNITQEREKAKAIVYKCQTDKGTKRPIVTYDEFN